MVIELVYPLSLNPVFYFILVSFLLLINYYYLIESKKDICNIIAINKIFSPC